MTSEKELKEWISNIDKESLLIEFKNSDILKKPEKLMHGIVAFSNRIGGKLLLGVNDDGSIEGWRILKPDDEKGKINNLIQDKISPILECDIEIVPCKEGDILIIHIPKKRDIPHAYVKKTSGGQILNREYLIRTPHGVRHVSDKQLQYLFQTKSIDINYQFRIIINYDEDLRINYNIEAPKSLFKGYGSFLANLPIDLKKKIITNEDKIPIFLFEITPYLLIQSFAWLFQSSWNIEIENTNKSLTERINSLENYNGRKFTVEDIPDIKSKSFLKELGFDLRTYLDYITFPNFYIPTDLNISIEYDYGKRTCLMMSHPDFEVSIEFFKPSGGLYLVQYEPQFAYYREELINLNFLEIKSHLEINFKFPETNYDKFDDFIKYGKNVKKILEEEWSYESFLSTQPNKLQYKILKKLDDIISKFNS